MSQVLETTVHPSAERQHALCLSFASAEDLTLFRDALGFTCATHMPLTLTASDHHSYKSIVSIRIPDCKEDDLQGRKAA